MKYIYLLLLLVGCQNLKPKCSIYPFSIDKDEATLGDYGLFAKITVFDYDKVNTKTFDSDMTKEYNSRCWREGNDFPEKKNFK